MTKKTSLWIDDNERNHEAAIKFIEESWVESKGHPGNTNKLVNAPWLSAHSYAHLNSFCKALISKLRYQTSEIFIGPPSKDEFLHRDPILVAGAYCKGEKDGKVTAYGLTSSYLSSLREAVVDGEKIKYIHHRIQTYIRDENHDNDHVSRYIDYTIAGTIMAVLADMILPQDLHIPSLLWETFYKNGWLTIPGTVKIYRNYPSKYVRIALRSFVHVKQRLLFEEEDNATIDDLLKEARNLRYRFSDNESLPDIPDEDYKQALDLWKSISQQSSHLSKALKPNVMDLSAGLIRFIFEARINSYPGWLHSATLAAPKKERIVLHCDLRKVELSKIGYRNKSINSLSLEGYEEAAGNLLLSDHKYDIKNALRCMLVIPFNVSLSNGYFYSGFIRFMNRYMVTEEGKCRLHNYEELDRNREKLDEPSQPERIFGIQLGRFLSDKLRDPLMPSTRIHDLSTDSGSSTDTNRPADPDSYDFQFDGGYFTKDKNLSMQYGRALKMAKAGKAVLVRGATGVGKQFFCDNLMKHCNRPGKYITVPCNEFTDTPWLINAQLFGAKKGFIPEIKRDHIGFFIKADKGCILLDEVGLLPIEAQNQLLLAVEKKVVRPMGADEDIPVDVMIIAATNADLEDKIVSGLFKEDLFYRLCSNEIIIPEFYQRPMDIWPFFVYKCQEAKLTLGEISDNLISVFKGWRWPANGRDFNQLVEQLLVQNDGREVGEDEIVRELILHLRKREKMAKYDGISMIQLLQEYRITIPDDIQDLVDSDMEV